MAEVDREGTGTIEFPEFLSISASCRCLHPRIHTNTEFPSLFFSPKCRGLCLAVTEKISARDPGKCSSASLSYSVADRS